MSALAPSSSVDAITPRPLVVRRARAVLAGQRLDLGRLRGRAAAAALGGRARGPDLVFPFELQEEMQEELETAGCTASLWQLESAFGHDAFLADQLRLAGVLRASGCFASGRRPR